MKLLCKKNNASLMSIIIVIEVIFNLYLTICNGCYDWTRIVMDVITWKQ